MTNILLVGSGAREHAIAKAINRSTIAHQLFCYASHHNPGIIKLTQHYHCGDLKALDLITAYAREQHIDFAIIGPEAPLALGLVDHLQQHNIACIGPTQQLAQIETSKGFARNLLTQHNIPGSPRYRNFTELTGVNAWLAELGDAYVVKADGLMGGKGVKVAGEHLHSHQQALQYCEQLIQHQQPFVIEEKLIGQEFSLLSFVAGNRLVHMPLVQDHKRALVDDQGPNTGGMGCYTDANHLLPFITAAELQQAQTINEATIAALNAEANTTYRGILYGGFMATQHGVKLIEYNARFGDPEAVNLLSLLTSDFIAICQAMLNQQLSASLVQFKQHASVCKYAVPKGYPDNPVKQQTIDISNVTQPENLFYASVDASNNDLTLLGSRAIAVIGIAETIAAAETLAETQIQLIQGPLYHRPDIGTAQLINQRIQHMQSLREVAA